MANNPLPPERPPAPAESPPAAPPPTGDPDGFAAPDPRHDPRSFGDLLSELSNETTTLVRQEIALAKREIEEAKNEIKEEARVAAKQAAFIAAGGAVAYSGLIVLLVGLGWLLGQILDEELIWLGLLVVGALEAAVGFALAKKGMNRLQALQPPDTTPDRTIKTLKEDKEWLKNETP